MHTISAMARNVARRRAGRVSLAEEPSRGLGASRRPFGDVRFTGPSARYDDIPSGQQSKFPRHCRETTAKHQTTKVSTLSQDLTTRPMLKHR